MFTWIETGGVEIATPPALAAAAPRLRVFFSSRRGGVSAPPYDSLNLGGTVGDRRAAVARNRRMLLRAIGLDPRRIARAEQVHGPRVAVVDRGGVYRRADGLLTARRGLALVIGTADCVPVILHSPPEMVCAALHVGRAGAASGILARGLDLLLGRFRVDPRTLLAVIGPGICGGCYEVGRAEAAAFPAWASRRSAGGRFLDLPAFIRRVLAGAGLPASNLFESGICTACDPERCFSHRRDRGRTGRHWTAALMSADPAPAGSRRRRP